MNVVQRARESISITSYVGRSSSPYTTYSAYNNLALEAQEKEFVFVFTMGEALDPNARLVFDMGTALATVQINSIQVDEIIEEVPLGTIEPKVENVIYPNPFQHVLHIQGSGERLVRIFDFGGRVHDQQQIEGDSMIDFSFLAPGAYVLQVQGKNSICESHLVVKE